MDDLWLFKQFGGKDDYFNCELDMTLEIWNQSKYDTVNLKCNHAMLDIEIEIERALQFVCNFVVQKSKCMCS